MLIYLEAKSTERGENARRARTLFCDRPGVSVGDAAEGSKPRMRSKCFINGAATQLRVLKQLGTALVDVNGQTAGMLQQHQ